MTVLRRSRHAGLCTLIAVSALAACGDASLRAGTLAGDSLPTTSAPASTTASGVLPSSTAGTPTESTTLTAVTEAPVATAPATSAATSAPTTSIDPATRTAPSADDCPDSERGAVVYRPLQRAVLCESGAIVMEFPVTTARQVPKPGEFTVSSRNRWVRSTIGGHVTTLTNFVAFTEKSPRIAFHTVPMDLDGKWVQPLSSVGDLRRWGESAGCIRVLPEISEVIWDFLRNGDLVRIVG